MDTICTCGEKMPLRVCNSAAGHYLGHFCHRCGPYDRVSGYWRRLEDAQAALDVELAFEQEEVLERAAQEATHEDGQEDAGLVDLIKAWITGKPEFMDMMRTMQENEELPFNPTSDCSAQYNVSPPVEDDGFPV